VLILFANSVCKRHLQRDVRDDPVTLDKRIAWLPPMA
jgi:hypothetical protein